MRSLDPRRLPKSYRLTITMGFGSSLFLTEQGDDRFGIRHFKPSALKKMISLPGDAPGFSPADTASDLIFVVASDHPYVNIHVARRLTKHVDPRITVKHLEQAFSRPDLLDAVVSRLRDRVTLHLVEGGDHSFRVRGRPRDDDGTGRSLGELAARFILERVQEQLGDRATVLHVTVAEDATLSATYRAS